MDSEHIKKMMDSFYKAKRILDLRPKLPKGITSSYITILDVIEELHESGKEVKVSDIANHLHLPVPGITRALLEMDKKDLVLKKQDINDKRVVHILTTKKGRKLRKKYVTQYFGELSKKMSDISNEKIEKMVVIIDKVGKEFGI